MALRDKLEKARNRYAKYRAERKQAHRGPRRRKLAGLVRFWRERKGRLATAVKRDRQRRRERKLLAPGAPGWGGCRVVTDEIVRIVGNRAPVTSRKRTETYGNPGSDHHVSQTVADAVDFGIANAYSLAAEVKNRLGSEGPFSDYAYFYIERTIAGQRLKFRVQGIAGTHGTGPHLHYGVERA